MQHAETILGVFWNYIVMLDQHVADIKYDTEWCDYAWESFRILK